MTYSSQADGARDICIAEGCDWYSDASSDDACIDAAFALGYQWIKNHWQGPDYEPPVRSRTPAKRKKRVTDADRLAEWNRIMGERPKETK